MNEFFEVLGKHPFLDIFLGLVGVVTLAIIGDTIVGVCNAIFNRKPTNGKEKTT